MKQFIFFIRKEFLHVWRDKRTMLILFGMPLAQILIFVSHAKLKILI